MGHHHAFVILQEANRSAHDTAAGGTHHPRTGLTQLFGSAAAFQLKQARRLIDAINPIHPFLRPPSAGPHHPHHHHQSAFKERVMNQQQQQQQQQQQRSLAKRLFLLFIVLAVLPICCRAAAEEQGVRGPVIV